MTEQQFISKLQTELKRNNVSDTSDIIEEYEQHFAFKLADGYAEEEIAARLGDPESIAAQYYTEPTKKGNKAIVVIGLGIADFFFGLLCVLLFAWLIVMVGLVLCCGASAVCLIGNLGRFIPDMPYSCAFIFGLVFISLTVLSVVGTVYFFCFVSQLMRSFGRFHKNALASASGRAALPPVAVYPQFSVKAKRCLRMLSLAAVTVFAVCFIVGFIACVVSSGSIEFWHTWGWFGYKG